MKSLLWIIYFIKINLISFHFCQGKIIKIRTEISGTDNRYDRVQQQQQNASCKHFREIR